MRVRFGEMIREGPEKQPVVGSVCCDRSGFVRGIMKAEWVDGFEIKTAVNSKEIVSGGKWLECNAPIDKFIAFVKNGAEVSIVF